MDVLYLEGIQRIVMNHFNVTKEEVAVIMTREVYHTTLLLWQALQVMAHPPKEVLEHG